MADADVHWRKLENLYVGAPTNEYYRPQISIGDGACEIHVKVREDFYHSAHAVHGSVYFKLLDDAGFFAANSVVLDVFVLTADFTIHLFRPVSEGILVAKGHVVSSSARQVVAQAELFNADRKIAHGIGTYVRSRILLDASVGYQ